MKRQSKVKCPKSNVNTGCVGEISYPAADMLFKFRFLLVPPKAVDI